MSLSIYDINIIPPYIAVKQSYNMYNVITPQNSNYYMQGYVWKVNCNTINFQSGDRILYENSSERPPIEVGGIVFDLVNESKIFLIEPPEEPK